MKLTRGRGLKVVLETAKPYSVIRFCFDKEITSRAGRCFFLKLSNTSDSKYRKIPMTVPSVKYKEE